MDDHLNTPGAGSFDDTFGGDGTTSSAQHRRARPERRGWSVRPGVVVALLVAAALVVFVVQNDTEVPVSWLFVEVNGPLWAVIIVAAVAGAVLGEVVGWVVGHLRRRRRRREASAG